MKKILAVLVFAVAFAVGAQAQTSAAHDAVLSVQPASDATSASIYKVYRAPLPKPTDACSLSLVFANVAQTTPGGSTATDIAVTAGALYCFYVTHVLNGIESAPSPFAIDSKTGLTAIKIPGPNASGGVTIVVR